MCGPTSCRRRALAELAVLQDRPYRARDVAINIIEKELGGPLGAFFSTISEEPVAAASLAQVYKAQLDDGRSVAVKVQRPQILEQVSKDLYVFRGRAEVYQRLIDRFAPQQKTNYVDLLNEWAVGFYTAREREGRRSTTGERDPGRLVACRASVRARDDARGGRRAGARALARGASARTPRARHAPRLYKASTSPTRSEELCAR